MTTDDKYSQVGQLMYDLKRAKSEAKQGRDRVEQMQRILNRCGTRTLRYCLTENNKEFLSTGGHWEDRVELPTTAELLAAVKQCEDLEREVRQFEEQLSNLGFTQP